uniref:Uncharacterized protein n=1 Tax=Arundo donax TaxID=35708 RepID=A0A0A9A4G1_ARUDO
MNQNITMIYEHVKKQGMPCGNCNFNYLQSDRKNHQEPDKELATCSLILV